MPDDYPSPIRHTRCVAPLVTEASCPPARGPLREDLDVAVGSVDADPLAIPDQPGHVVDADDRRYAVLPRDHGTVRHEAADLRDQAGDRDEQGRPAGVGEGGDQDVA